MEKKCTVVRAEDGHLVPVLQNEGTKRHLGSCYDGIYAATRWADAHVSQRTENVILFGMGDCQIVLELMKRVPGRILIYEPEVLVYENMKSSALYKKAVKNHKGMFFCEGCLENLGQEIRKLLDDDWVERTMIIAHPGYQDLYAKEFENLRGICQQLCDDITFMRAPLKRFTVSMLRNQITNFPRMSKGIPLHRLKDKWNPDLPVILVSAGPSLEKNVEELKKVDGRALIWCADAALPTLLEHNIVPDIVASVDSAKNINCFSDSRSLSIPLLGSSNTRREIIAGNDSVVIWGFDHEQILMMMKRAGVPLPQVPYYLGVSTAMYASAVELGSRVIILVGQDLAFAESGRSHVNGRDESKLQGKKYVTEGYAGGKVSSRMDWMEFKKWFEKMIVLYPDHNVINATEGGVRIQGTKQQALADVIKSLPDVENCFTELLIQKENQISEVEAEILVEQQHQCVCDLKEVRNWGYFKTFFEKDYRQFPVMRMVIDYMKILDDEREERFEKATTFLKEEFDKGGWCD